ncbi:MAG: hypothetical protein ACM3OH_14450 [Bacillota bacterium]|jgi:hypothetical protein
MRRHSAPELNVARYRAARRYRLVPPDELPASIAPHLADCRNDPEFGGVLLPRDDGGDGVRALTHAAAELFRSVARPRPVDTASAGGPDALARLVLDGVLEVECRGAFVSRARAHELYFDGSPPAWQSSRLASVSGDAVQHAESLGISDPRVLRQRLYRYSTRPASPVWRRRLATDAAVSRYLRIGRMARGMSHTLEPAWHYWRPVRRKANGAPAFKLYISPGIDDTPAALDATLAVLGRARGIVAVKAGRDVHALMRPDKLVAYFSDRESLHAAAAELGTALGGTPPQGVPFTSDLAGDGLLSWATDPPADTTTLDWAGDGSWRAWIAARLASSLALAASERDASTPAWLFAVDRLSLDGVDLATWAPISGVWAGAEN